MGVCYEIGQLKIFTSISHDRHVTTVDVRTEIRPGELRNWKILEEKQAAGPSELPFPSPIPHSLAHNRFKEGAPLYKRIFFIAPPPAGRVAGYRRLADSRSKLWVINRANIPKGLHITFGLNTSDLASYYSHAGMSLQLLCQRKTHARYLHTAWLYFLRYLMCSSPKHKGKS